MNRLLVTAVTVLLGITLASAAVTDSYSPVCPDFPFSNTPTSAWKRWSSPSTWPGGVVPGVGANTGSTVTIDCSMRVLLDVSITIDLLVINGWLKVVDKGPFQVMTNFVLVQGQLTIGTPTVPYDGKITFNLTGTNYQLNITRAPASVAEPRNLGYRAFAVVGGAVSLNGMYGNNPSWMSLANTLKKGDTNMVLKGDLSSWPIGGKVAVASTDFDWRQAENFTIRGVTKGSGSTTLTLDRPATYMHQGDLLPTGVPGVMMNESAEVVLLTRSIVIQGHPNPVDPLIGGHFIVFQTNTKQFIGGVELVNMGQQGTIGRYPMHFHLCQDVTGSLVSNNVVHDSNQRCFVTHGTWNLKLFSNAGVQTKGHCFILEDGIEFGNTFDRNVGFLQEPPKRIIVPTDAIPATETDGNPSTFWISNPNNTFTNNHAAGSFDSGWWFEVAAGVAGPSSNFPLAGKVAPKFIPVKKFDGNVAHSSGRAGLRTYPSGYRPRLNGGVSNNQATAGINAPSAGITFSNFRAYKNDFIGMFIHETDSLTIDGAMIADNAVVGIEFNQDQGNTIKNSRFMGETANYGNPSQCTMMGNNYANCKMIVGCGFPVTDPSNARSNGITRRDSAQFGILIDQSEYPSHGLNGPNSTTPAAHHIVNSTFSLFSNQCRVSAGITASGQQSALWSASHSSKQLVFPDNSPRIWLTPSDMGQLGFGSPGQSGSVPRSFVWWDQDGTMIGKPGYVVANNPTILPINSNTTCTPHIADWNGYACPGTCYRTVGISVSGATGKTTITRIADGSSMDVGGYGGLTFVNLLAGSAYQLSFSSPPSSVSLMYGDGGEGCNGGIVMQFAPPSPTTKWTAQASKSVFWKACAGSSISTGGISQVSWVCNNNSPNLQVSMGPTATGPVTVTQTSGVASCTSLECGLAIPGASWVYDDNGDNPTVAFASLSFVPTGWKTGNARFGYGGMGETTTINRASSASSAWYFRQTFTVGSPSCIQSLLMGVLVDDGVVVYINGNEVTRINLPAGPLTSTTKATQDPGPQGGWTIVPLNVAAVGLKQGANLVAVEVHSSQAWSWEIGFDLWISALASNICNSVNLYAGGSSSSFRKLSPPSPKRRI